MAANEIISRSGRIWREEATGIVRFEAAVSAEQREADARENFDAIKTLCAGKKSPMLVDLTRCKVLHPDARAYYGRPEWRTLYTALALISTSPVGKMLGNMWFAINRDREIPTKIFTSVPEAIAWLKTYPG